MPRGEEALTTFRESRTWRHDIDGSWCTLFTGRLALADAPNCSSVWREAGFEPRPGPTSSAMPHRHALLPLATIERVIATLTSTKFAAIH